MTVFEVEYEFVLLPRYWHVMYNEYVVDPTDRSIAYTVRPGDILTCSGPEGQHLGKMNMNRVAAIGGGPLFKNVPLSFSNLRREFKTVSVSYTHNGFRKVRVGEIITK